MVPPMSLLSARWTQIHALTSTCITLYHENLGNRGGGTRWYEQWYTTLYRFCTTPQASDQHLYHSCTTRVPLQPPVVPPMATLRGPVVLGWYGSGRENDLGNEIFSLGPRLFILGQKFIRGSKFTTSTLGHPVPPFLALGFSEWTAPRTRV